MKLKKNDNKWKQKRTGTMETSQKCEDLTFVSTVSWNKKVGKVNYCNSFVSDQCIEFFQLFSGQ